MTSQVAGRIDLLPGYHALERLGSGGYGEVWKAEAPGGLVKAVKLIHGFSHEQRASDELKALERVKSVRHPFLLSLERIETIDNRLFIVTELADGSLKDHFNACLRRGKSGVPRAELLNCLRDAADALDFMSEVHGLQHLDIKPENLLLVAGHVKVADFGLVKDVQRQCVSLVGGLTPVYAAPEVFHGRPSRYSDQYSLAVVYQQMLTGTLPFSGGSAAELTLQHLNEEPDLAALPPGDRPAVARALSKNPEHRFASCRTLVDALIEGMNVEALGASIGTHLPDGKSRSKTASPDMDGTLDRNRYEGDSTPEEDTAPATSNVTLNFADLDPPRVTVRKAPPFQTDAFQAAPTLVVSIGGAGGHVLRQFKRRIAERFGEAGEVPAVATLLIDTDSSDLLQATHGRGPACLTPQETLPVPLRRPQEYRSRHGQPFRWLSRRWLYNVPRSLKTEGLRPLGRLAFVDHAKTIRARLERALDQVLDRSSIEQSTQRTGLPLDGGHLRVYVVASICGGTGSGMALDLAYMLQSLIDERGVECEGITGVLLLQTPEQPRVRELAAVNAFAWLTEYNHFNRSGAAFPGDPSCGLAPRDIDERAFGHTYVVHLGEGDLAGEGDGRAADVAEYIYLDALTPVNSFLAACRRAEHAANCTANCAALATFAIATRDASRSREVERVSMELVQKVLTSWLGVHHEPAARDTSSAAESDSPDEGRNSHLQAPPHIERACATEAQTLQLEARQLLMLAAKLLEVELRATPRAFFQRLSVELRGSRESIDPQSILQAVDRMFGGPPTPQDQAETMVVLRKPLGDVVQPLIAKMEQHLTAWLQARLDDPDLRLAGAMDAANWFSAHLRKVSQELLSKDARIARQIEQQPSFDNTPPDAGSDPQEAVFEYFSQRLERAAMGAALGIARSLARVATQVHGKLVGIARTVRELAEHHKESRLLMDSRARQSEDASADDIRRKLAEALLAQENQWVATINEVVRQRVAAQGGLYLALCGDPDAREDLLAVLDDASRRCVRGVIANPELLERLLGKSDAAVHQALTALFQEARPRCLEYGGTVYRGLTSPRDANIEDVQRHAAAADELRVAVVEHAENRLVACTEVQNVSLMHLSLAMIRNRRDYASFAQRVLSRKDVPWSPLVVDQQPTAADDPVIQTVVL